MEITFLFLSLFFPFQICQNKQTKNHVSMSTYVLRTYILLNEKKLTTYYRMLLLNLVLHRLLFGIMESLTYAS